MDVITVEMIKRAVLSIIPEYSIKRVSLFGARATETNRDNSDVDLIMEFTTPISLIMLSEIQIRLEELLGLSVYIIHGPVQESDILQINNEIELYVA